MPFGGKFQKTPIQSMVAKLPVLSGNTNTGTIMSYGYNPKLSKWSPFPWSCLCSNRFCNKGSS